eukprot:1322759-Alexandrium_andersonii.AAC.1
MQHGGMTGLHAGAGSDLNCRCVCCDWHLGGCAAVPFGHNSSMPCPVPCVGIHAWVRHSCECA